MIDTSGEGLHKRGYRRKSNDAPLKETLGAAMCDLARIYPDTLMFDPFCGSGTLLIEAALKATNTAPGLRRFFSAERFGFIPDNIWREERMRAQDLIVHNIEFRAQGFDTDPNAVALTNENAEKAGTKKYVKASVGDDTAILPYPMKGAWLLPTRPTAKDCLMLRRQRNYMP